ncbi:MAG TPA: hypothetical protein VGR86_00910 [Steroidobacteraceae bacterium]|nr:hypothetical protein [Steroidobacteraceae bacterium]
MKTEQVVEELQSVLEAMEGIVAEVAKGNGAHGLGGVVDRFHKQVDQARKRVRDFEGAMEERVRQGATAADRSIRRNPWESMLVTALIAFALGAMLARRD